MGTFDDRWRIIGADRRCRRALPNPPAAMTESGIEWHHVPVMDVHAPSVVRDAMELGKSGGWRHGYWANSARRRVKRYGR